MSNTGYLRRDEDCHWFLIPSSEVDRFDELLDKHNDLAGYDLTPEGEEELNYIESEINEFWKYRVSDPYDVKCLIPEGDNE